MGSFFLGVLASLVAAFVFAGIAWSRGWLLITWRRFRDSRSLMIRLDQAGVSNFYASRVDYVKYRDAPTLPAFLSLARKSVRIAAYWMAQGIEMQGVASAVANLIRPPKNLSVTIAIIDPTAAYVSGFAQYLGIREDELVMRAQSALYQLWKARDGLSQAERDRFQLKVYTAVPVASVIMLDPEEDGGRLQIDVKPYKAPRESSFALELSGSGHPLYETCRDSWLSLLDDAAPFDPARHLVGYSV